MNNRITTFINSFDKDNSPFLNEMEQVAKENNIPIIRREVQSLLRFLVTVTKPGSILEIGTAIGFSALLMLECAPANCRITTIENYKKRIAVADENFRKAGCDERILLLEGDAIKIMGTLEGSYPFIFMDAAKGQYIHFLPDVLRLLAPGGLLVSDNVLQDGDVMESRYAVTRRDRTIHSRMREYLYEIKNHPLLETCILPVGDGVSLSVKK